MKTGVQINCRVSRKEYELLKRLVDEANERAMEMGAPGTLTISALVKHWIKGRLFELFTDQHELRSAAHLEKALAVLHKARKP